MAISAVDTALWDLKARLLELPAAHAARSGPRRGPGLRQRRVHHRRRRTGCASSSTGGLEQGIPRVKIKIGESWGTNQRRDLDRVALARQTIGADVELFVDANGGYDAGQAVRVARAPRRPRASPGSRNPSAPTTTGACGGSARRATPTSPRGSTATASPTSPTCSPPTPWTACRSTSPGAAATPSGCGSQRSPPPTGWRSRRTAPRPSTRPSALATPNLRHLEWFEDHVRIESRFLEGFPSPPAEPSRRRRGAGHGLTVRERRPRNPPGRLTAITRRSPCPTSTPHARRTRPSRQRVVAEGTAADEPRRPRRPSPVPAAVRPPRRWRAGSADRPSGRRSLPVRAPVARRRRVLRPDRRPWVLRRPAGRRAVRLGWQLRGRHPDLAQPLGGRARCRRVT